MRADLQTMEQIDLYLQGKMTAAESAVFENSMALNPELGQQVAEQQLFAQTINRKALLAEINLVAGGNGGAWYSNPYVGFAGATIVIGIVAATIYYSKADDINESIVENINTESALKNNENLIDESQLNELPNDSINYADAIKEHKTDRNINLSTTANDNIDDNESIGNDNGNVLNPEEKDNGIKLIDATTKNDVSFRKVINKTACFPKGYKAMRTYVTEKVIYPGTAKKDKIQANVKVKFLVGKEGQISEIVSNCFCLRGENEKALNATQMMMNSKIVKLFEEKCTSTIRTMPSWEAATDSQGNRVVSIVTVYFNFSLYEGISIYQLDDADDK